MLLVLIFSLLLCCTSVSPAAVFTTTPAPNVSTTEAPKSVKQIEKEIESMVTSVTKMLLPYFVRNSDLKLSPSCMSTFIKLFMDLRKLKLPAVKLLDAMGKPPYGLLHGTFSIIGDYDECLEVRATKKGDVAVTKAEEYYHGQYCTVEIEFPPTLLTTMKEYGNGKANITEFGKLGSFIQEFPATNFAGKYFKYHLGICLPSTCTENDLTEILGLVPVSFVPMRVKRCDDGLKKPMSVDQMVFLVVLILIAVLVMSGTALDGWFHLKYSTYRGEHKDKFIQFLLAFSLYNNTKKLLKVDKSPSGEISCVNGMYSLGTLLVVIYHTYFLPFFLLFSSHSSNLGTYLKDFEFTLVITMGISIEAYFLFSGLFLVYPRFRRAQKSVNVNVIKIIVRRYIRLCPSMLFVLGLIVLLPLFGTGPVWADIFDVAADNTRKWWWTYALMFNNFLEVKEQNFLYLWFIPCLMQISIIGAFLLWIIAKYPKTGIILTVLVGVACDIALGVITAEKGYPPAYAIYYYHNREHFEIPIYTSPLSHVFSYGIGMLLGLYMAKNPTIKWSKTHVVIGWILSLFLTVGTQLLIYIGRDGLDPDPVVAAIYGATHRTGFAIGLAWIILACTHGYAGFFGKLLCWRGFGPLSKLGYFAYLIHYIIISYHVSVVRTPLTFSHFEIWMRFSGYVLLTFVAAYILYITFELPLTFVESLFLPSRPTNSAVQNNSLPNGNSNSSGVVKQNGGLSNSVPKTWNGTTSASNEHAEHSRL